MTQPDPDAPQPRDIAVEQPSPELLEQLEDESGPDARPQTDPRDAS
jgi:hypothetical protein